MRDRFALQTGRNVDGVDACSRRTADDARTDTREQRAQLGFLCRAVKDNENRRRAVSLPLAWRACDKVQAAHGATSSEAQTDDKNELNGERAAHHRWRSAPAL